MAAAEPGCELADARPVRADEHLRVARPVLDPDRPRGRRCGLDRRADLRGPELARPHMRQRHAERRQGGRQPVGHGQRLVLAAGRESVDGQLAAWNVLLDEERRAPRGRQRDRHGLRDVVRSLDEREPTLALAVRRLDDARKADAFCGLDRLRRSRADLEGGLRNAGLGEALPLTELRGRQHGRLRREGMRQPEAAGDSSCNRDRPVDPGRDQPVDALGAGEALDAGLVLGGDDGAPVGVAEARRGGVAVDGDHVQLARACGGQQAKLRRAGA